LLHFTCDDGCVCLQVQTFSHLFGSRGGSITTGSRQTSQENHQLSHILERKHTFGCLSSS
jgi:hypothetical protein